MSRHHNQPAAMVDKNHREIVSRVPLPGLNYHFICKNTYCESKRWTNNAYLRFCSQSCRNKYNEVNHDCIQGEQWAVRHKVPNF